MLFHLGSRTSDLGLEREQEPSKCRVKKMLSNCVLGMFSCGACLHWYPSQQVNFPQWRAFDQRLLGSSVALVPFAWRVQHLVCRYAPVQMCCI